LNDFAVNANPARLVSAAGRLRSFSGRITRNAFRFGLCLRHLDHLSIDADPAKLSASRLRSFPGRITGIAFRLGLSLEHLDDLSVDADPTKFPFTIPLRFVWRVVTAKTFRLGVSLGHLNDLSINANPAELFTLLLCFLLGSVAVDASVPGLRLGDLDDLSV
jgi:hypothetical protein